MSGQERGEADAGSGRVRKINFTLISGVGCGVSPSKVTEELGRSRGSLAAYPVGDRGGKGTRFGSGSGGGIYFLTTRESGGTDSLTGD